MMSNKPEKESPVIGLVGPCKSGKTVLKRGLVTRGYQVKHIAQEHSYVQDMWRKIAKPDLLIYLDASFEITLERSNLVWTKNEYDVQMQRLSHARHHADLIIHTDSSTPEEILKMAIDYIENPLAD